MSLHEKLIARLDELEALAKKATPGPWRHVDFADPPYQPMTSEGMESTYMGCGSVITMGEGVEGGDIAAPNGDLYPRGGYSPDGDMAIIAAVASPDVVLRQVTEDREVLKRHQPLTYELTHETATTCNWCDGGEDRVPEWPCPDLESLARRLGVDVTS